MPRNHSFRCWVRHCVNARRRTRIPNSHFHAFPVKNAERCRQWLQAVGYEDLVYLPMHSLKMRYVCSEHFTEDDYGKTGCNASLLFTAVPSKFPPETIPLSDEIMEEWPPKLASDKSDSKLEVNEAFTSVLENHTEQYVLSIDSSLNDPSDKLLASAVSAGILQPPPPKILKLNSTSHTSAEMESGFEEPANSNQRKLPPLPQELLMQHLKTNSGQGLMDGDMLLGFVVQRGSTLQVVPVGPGHSTTVASCLEELLSPSVVPSQSSSISSIR